MPLNVDNIKTNTLIVNGADMCNTSSQVLPYPPFIVEPTFTRSCTKLTDTSGNGLNYQGWKLNGSIGLGGSNGYEEYLGTVRIKNGNTLPFGFFGEIPYNISGSVWWNSNFTLNGDLVNEPLSVINRGYDSVNEDTIYIESTFLQFFNTDGDDLLIDFVLFVFPAGAFPTPVNATINVGITFEIEVLVLDNVELSFIID